MRALALFACLLLPTVAPAQELKLPETVKGQPGSFVVVRAETDGKTVRWVMLDDGCSMLPPDLMKDSRAAIVFTPRAGKFRLLAYSAKGDEPSEPRICILEIGDAVPPKPPTPPVPPGPIDPLAAKLQQAYDADAAAVAVKETQIAALYGLYAAMAETCDKDQTLKTLGDVLAQLHKTAKDLKLAPDGLIAARKLIAVEVATLGTSPGVPFDAALRVAAVNCFTRIAAALELVK
jgi:hypothetical protein